MEVYFKDLISEEKSLERLVDDLARIVQGADDFAKAVEGNLSEDSRRRMANHLAQLKRNYGRLRAQAAAGVRATDKLLRENPYASIGIAFATGLLIGVITCRKHRNH